MNIFVKNCLWLRASKGTVVASAVYFNLEEEIKQNCEFEFYFNETNITPSVLDGGHQILLENWPSYKRIIGTIIITLLSIFPVILMSFWNKTFYAIVT